MPDHTEVTVAELPPCDMCGDGTPALYDAKTRRGSWGYLCENHYDRFGVGLGLGRGQRLVVK